MRASAAVALAACLWVCAAFAEEPSVSYIFPAGGQRGTTVQFKVGGHYLHGEASFEMLGAGVEASSRIRETNTVWFEGPMIPLPASQQAEDYPKDHSGQVRIAGNAEPGVRYWRVWTSQGATPVRRFMVGELPEIVEDEIDGDPLPVAVELPVTINGRIFPREDVDLWTFRARAGVTITCEVAAKALGSPLEARLEIVSPNGRALAEGIAGSMTDPRLHFEAPADGVYRVRIHDLTYGGLQHYVYRLTLTTQPFVSSVFPLGGRRGTTTRFQLHGQALSADSVEIRLPTEGPDVFQTYLRIGEWRSNPVLVELDDLPERIENEPNSIADLTQVEPLALPAVLNGRIGAPGDADYWPVGLKKDEECDLDLRASRLGSPLDSVLTVLDAQDKEIARNDDFGGEQTDSRLRFKAPADGNYFLGVQERFASRGGPAFAYRLRVAAPPGPDFRLQIATDAVTVFRELTGLTDEEKKKRPPAKEAKLRVELERSGGFAGEVELMVDGLPPGVSVKTTKIPANQNKTELAFSATPTAKIEARHISIRGSGQVNGQTVTHEATLPGTRGEPALDHVLLAVAMPTPFRAYGEYLFAYGIRGSVYRRRYFLERGGYSGALTVRLADRQFRHLQGVHGPEIRVPEEAKEFEYPLSLPPWMEIGRTSRSVVMAAAVVKDHDGSEHVVSYSSGEQNDQIIAVVSPGLMSIEAARRSLLAQPETLADVRLRIQRDTTIAKDAVKIELILPRHFQGVSAEPTTLASDATEASLRVKFGRAPGPFNMPAILRATILSSENPTVAETFLEFVTDY